MLSLSREACVGGGGRVGSGGGMSFDSLSPLPPPQTLFTVGLKTHGLYRGDSCVFFGISLVL